jgi:hypothetical protein
MPLGSNASEPGQTRSAKRLPDAEFVALVPTGDLMDASAGASPGSTLVRRLAPDLSERWHTVVQGFTVDGITSAGDDAVLRGAPDSIYARPARVIRISADGSTATTVYDCVECALDAVQGDAQGRVLVVAHGDRGRAQLVASPDGSQTTVAPGFIAATGGLDGQGNVVLLGSADPTSTSEPCAPGDRCLVKLGLSDGSRAWTSRFGLPDILVGDIGFSASGTVVLVGTSPARVVGTFGGDPIPDACAYLFTVEADGTPRWVRPLQFGMFCGIDAWTLAVQPAGKLLLVQNDTSALRPPTVHLWNLAGDQLWTRSWLLGPDGHITDAHALATTDTDAFVTLWMWGTIDFGSGPVSTPTSGYATGVLLDLVP